MKSFLRVMASSIFRFGLVAAAFASAFVLVFGNSTAIKQALRSSKVYNTASEAAVTATQNNTGELRQANSPKVGLSDEQLKQAVKTAMPASEWQSDSEQVIDSLYRWLRTGATKPDFKLDLAPAKQRFANSVADSTIARVQQLPVCNRQQLLQLAQTPQANIDPLNISCLPPGYNPESARSKIVSELVNNQDYLKNTVITADSLPKNKQGRSIFDSTQRAPQVFHWLLLAPWVIGGLTLLTGGALLWLHDDKRRGLRQISTTLAGSGIFIFVSTWLLVFILKKASQPTGVLGKMSPNSLQQALLAAVQPLNHMLSINLFLFAKIYLLIGIAGLLIVRPSRPNKSILANYPEDHATETSSIHNNTKSTETNPLPGITSDTTK